MKILLEEDKKEGTKEYLIVDCEEDRVYKVGEIIYPHYNKTGTSFKKSRWDLILKVNDKGNPIETRFIWDFATVRAIELMQELEASQSKSKENVK